MTNGDEPSAGMTARDGRRWLIGIVISVVFGLFSGVMALLSYSERTRPAALPNRDPRAQAPSSEPPRRDSVRRDRRH
jgi:hypothetical protein